MMAMFFMSMALSLILILLNSTVGEKMFFSREMNSSFECGFDPKSLARLPFSLHFFLIALIFLIFDVEITLLVPVPMTCNYSLPMTISMIVLVFIFILILGLMVEWKKGALEWSY